MLKDLKVFAVLHENLYKDELNYINLKTENLIIYL